MLKLMKYEFRKTMFSKAVLLVITAVLEILFLLGVFLNWADGIAWGIIGLTFCAIIGIFYIGLESLLVFQRDLNTKQSYMLFLTPHNSWQILGAKVIENGISLLLTGCFFLLLAMADMSVAIVHLGGLKELLNAVNDILKMINVEISITYAESFAMVLNILALWLMTIVTGMLAIVLSATVLAGKKLSGLTSFLLFLLVTWGCETLIGRLPEPQTFTLLYLVNALEALTLTVGMYLIAGWMMERKLSV
ncbi:MAG: hypothetical protein LUH07_07120 [Lachnospiraceae bacterium]|nr:hypothetical protein [Lachnospiraceae bacterium]